MGTTRPRANRARSVPLDGDLRTTTLRELLAGCAAGSHDDFERLYRMTAPKLYALCLGVLRRPELAEEVLQEFYTQIWHDAGRFAAYSGTPLTWMAVMVRNRAIDVLRRPAAEVRSFAENTATTDSESAPGDPVHQLQRLAESEALRRCLSLLRERHREAILLAFFRGLSHTELSRSMDQPVGTVKSWVRRGMAQLRRCLEQ